VSPPGEWILCFHHLADTLHEWNRLKYIQTSARGQHVNVQKFATLSDLHAPFLLRHVTKKKDGKRFLLFFRNDRVISFWWLFDVRVHRIYAVKTEWNVGHMNSVRYCKIITRLLQQAWCIHRHLAIFYLPNRRAGWAPARLQWKRTWKIFRSFILTQLVFFVLHVWNACVLLQIQCPGDNSGFASRTVRQSSWRLNTIHYHRGKTLLIYWHCYGGGQPWSTAARSTVLLMTGFARRRHRIPSQFQIPGSGLVV